jgi:hypothetical protein
LPLVVGAAFLNAQDLVPRAYVITPTGSNAVTVSYSWNDGKLAFDPTAPIEDSKGSFQIQILSYYHSFGLLGRSANIVVSQPYVVGNFEGVVAGVHTPVYRSGLTDSRVRLAINLRGAPTMRLKEYLSWEERSLIGVSVTAVVPIGQNDPARVINPGTNRWAFKPEIGFTKRWGRWVGEVYGGVWLFTPNRTYFPGESVRKQQPMGAAEAHLGYYVRPRLWASVDANFWTGGRSSVNSRENRDQQRNSRIGATASIPINRHQSLKFSFSCGAYVRIGGDFNTVSAAWQYSWLGKPN